MSKQFFGVLLAASWSTLWAGPVEDQAHARYDAVLSQIQAAPVSVSPRVNRLIGWPGPSVEGLSTSQRLSLLLEAHWDWVMHLSPESATFTGYPGQNHRWRDLSEDVRLSIEARERATLNAALQLRRDQLSPAEALDLDLFIYQREREVADQAFPEHLLLVNQMYGVHLSLAQTLGAMPLFSAEQQADYLRRLEAIPRVLGQATDRLEEGLKQGVTPPRMTLRTVPGQARGLVPARAQDSPLIKPLLNSEADAALRDEAVRLYETVVRSAVLDFAAFLDTRYLPGAVEATGLSALADGARWYAQRVRRFTTTELSPQQVHDIGVAEVERIRGEMLAVMREMGDRSGDLPAFVERLYRNPAYFYTDEQDMLRDYRALGKLADGRLVKLFRRFPALPYAIEAIPPHEAAGKSAAYYLPGSLDNGRPGTFYTNTSRLNEYPRFEMEALLLHEAVPGHHFQIALAQEQPALAEFRKHGRFTAYVEGWGLYAESLGAEMGFYQSPENRFGALTFEMWRAIRLVVDTGLHALGWSRDQAIEYFRANTGRKLGRIEAEVDRYLVMPGQALAYKMGELKIRELRERAELGLGEAFDIRAFHDFILSEGALPLAVLEARFDAWLAAHTSAS